MGKRRKRWLSRASIGLAAGAVLVAAALASAASAQDERGRAEAMVTELEGDVSHRALTAEVVARAHQYLTQGQKLRASGDETRAKLADAVAREWAEVGRDLVRTADLEQRAIRARGEADDAGAQVDRERALLDEAIAQNGRLRAQVEAAEHEKKQEPEKTSASAARDNGKNSGLARPKTPAPAASTVPKAPATGGKP
ncbi:MAG TPA: hypothetical protein VNO21_11590 [Polyangiaceae bacterium]|nr:hypothetical protein [Polyangiaceae bacterium]